MNNTIDFRSVPDALWVQIEPPLSRFCRTKSGGSKPNPQRLILAGILYKCRTRCQWAMIPRCYGSKSSIHEHFQRWTRAGIFDELFRIIFKDYAEYFGLDVVGANVHGSRLISQTLNASIEFGTYCIDSHAPNLCLDKGYDYERVHREVFVCGFEGRIRGRGEEAYAIKEGHTPKHWVVERTIARFKAFRSIRTRYCRYLRSFCASVALAASCILLRKFMHIK